MPVLARHPRAIFDYDILEKIEAGIELTGAEVKAARAGHVSLKGAYAAIRSGQAYLLGAHISPYAPAGTRLGYDPTRTRTFLLKKNELRRLAGKVESGGLTLIPLSVYTKAGLIKVELGLARGKKKYEKRAAIKKREVLRETRAALKS